MTPPIPPTAQPKAKRQKRAGRKKGTPNRATAAKAAAIAKTGITPLDYMLSVMRDGSQPSDMRLNAAKFAAPYVHPKLASIEHTGAGGAPLIPEANLDQAAFARRVAFLLAKGMSAAT